MSELIEKAKQAKQAASKLALMDAAQKNDALKQIALALQANTEEILRGNQKDLANGSQNGLSESMLDRLQLTASRIKDMADALIELIALQDPIGEVIDEWSRPNGLKITKVRVPLGVVGMIYEARPNVTVDASSLCLKTGNAVLLRGSSSAIYSNKAIVKVIQKALVKVDFPVHAIQLLEDTSRETAGEMFKLNEYLDVLIPRGGAGLIKSVVENASVPVLETGVGNCHVFIDESAERQMGIDIAINAKTQRPSVCNACETILVHESWAKDHFNELIAALQNKQVDIFADEASRRLVTGLSPATEKEWQEEFLDYAVAIKMVSSIDEAIAHINQYGTKHSEAIVTMSGDNVDRFFKHVDAAAVYHNASTRFTDGFEFGFGAEIGISTQKLHARGPMGLEAITSTKYVIRGHGQLK